MANHIKRWTGFKLNDKRHGALGLLVFCLPFTRGQIPTTWSGFAVFDNAKEQVFQSGGGMIDLIHLAAVLLDDLRQVFSQAIADLHASSSELNHLLHFQQFVD